MNKWFFKYILMYSIQLSHFFILSIPKVFTKLQLL